MAFIGKGCQKGFSFVPGIQRAEAVQRKINPEQRKGVVAMVTVDMTTPESFVIIHYVNRNIYTVTMQKYTYNILRHKRRRAESWSIDYSGSVSLFLHLFDMKGFLTDQHSVCFLPKEYRRVREIARVRNCRIDL